MHVAPGMACSDDDEIRCSCLPRYKFVWHFKSGAPFNLLEMPALGAESPADVIEASANYAAIMFRGLVIDDDASSGESGPQRQAGNSYEGRPKPVRQRERKLDPTLGIASDVDVDHHGCERHHLFRLDLFRLAAIKKGTDRTFRLSGSHSGHARCSASPLHHCQPWCLGVNTWHDGRSRMLTWIKNDIGGVK
jgi:hypothetical protein